MGASTVATAAAREWKLLERVCPENAGMAATMRSAMGLVTKKTNGVVSLTEDRKRGVACSGKSEVDMTTGASTVRRAAAREWNLLERVCPENAGMAATMRSAMGLVTKKTNRVVSLTEDRKTGV